MGEAHPPWLAIVIRGEATAIQAEGEKRDKRSMVVAALSLAGLVFASLFLLRPGSKSPVERPVLYHNAEMQKQAVQIGTQDALGNYVQGKTSVLVIDEVLLPNDVVGALANDTGIRTLRLTGRAATSDSIEAVIANRWIENLYLVNCHVTDSDLARIVKSPALKELFVVSDQLTPACFKAIADSSLDACFLGSPLIGAENVAEFNKRQHGVPISFVPFD